MRGLRLFDLRRFVYFFSFFPFYLLHYSHLILVGYKFIVDYGSA